ncbi:MAG: hypothetical protein RBR77_07475 [Thauera sp.]|jgi:hypothetical protein|nr:hypothetical protein [Thauera sp.]
MSREAFEAWVMQKRGITRDVTIDGGMYWVGEVEIAWQAWQAARAAALEEAAEIADAHATCEGIGQRIAVEIRALKEKE